MLFYMEEETCNETSNKTLKIACYIYTVYIFYFMHTLIHTVDLISVFIVMHIMLLVICTHSEIIKFWIR